MLLVWIGIVNYFVNVLVGVVPFLLVILSVTFVLLDMFDVFFLLFLVIMMIMVVLILLLLVFSYSILLIVFLIFVVTLLTLLSLLTGGVRLVRPSHCRLIHDSLIADKRSSLNGVHSIFNSFHIGGLVNIEDLVHRFFSN